MVPADAQATRLRPRLVTSIATSIGAVVTLCVLLIPSVRFAYRAPGLHVAFDTAEGLIALVAAYLVFGRLRERQLLRDALLVFALLLIGSANLLLLVAPPLGPDGEFLGVGLWTSLVIRLIGSGAIALAAFTRSRRIPPRWAAGANVPVATGAALAMAVIVGSVASKAIPLGLAPNISPLQGDPVIAGAAPLLGAQLILVALFSVAAVGFTKAAESSPGDPFLRWLGPGTALSASARVNFFLFPSIYTEYIYVGDFLRLAFYLLLLFGASQEVRLYWRRLEHEIAEHERLNVELEALSLTDPLTGLNNRRGFETLAEHEMTIAARAKKPVALMFIDLNEMKTINDVHGHDAGDEALCEVASILKETFRDSDIIARLGGDEFCALLTGDSRDVEVAQQRLRAAVDPSKVQAQRPYRLSLSIGMAHWDPEQPQSLDALLEIADSEMYANKRGSTDGGSILVVEDDSSIQQLIRVGLGDGHEIWEAQTAATALSIASDRALQLVILDYYLPDATGLQLVETLRARLGPKVPIVVLTGASDVDEAAVLRTGADDYLEKPFDLDVLKARIDRLLATSRRR